MIWFDAYFDSVSLNEESRLTMTAHLIKMFLKPRKISRFVSRKIKNHFLAIYHSKNQNEDSASGKASAELNNFNYDFLDAFNQFLSKGKNILFLCAENAIDTRFFEQLFLSRHLKSGNYSENHYEIYKVKDANHIYTFVESQNILIDKITQWLESKYIKNQQLDAHEISKTH